MTLDFFNGTFLWENTLKTQVHLKVGTFWVLSTSASKTFFFNVILLKNGRKTDFFGLMVLFMIVNTNPSAEIIDGNKSSSFMASPSPTPSPLS